ncbi:MAG: trehalose-6-phosphate synthase [candidate division WOR-3 bacterium]
MNRLKAYEIFLRNNPQYFNKVVLIMVVVPGRVGVERYQKTKSEIDEYVGKINGEFGNIEWTTGIDVMLVTPLRDGMNLISKEFIASKRDGKGVLILSETALVNPNDISEIAN